MSTRETTLDQLTEGDVVLAINGVDRPFPYTVTRVINLTHGKNIWTTVHYAHGGLALPWDGKTARCTIAA